MSAHGKDSGTRWSIAIGVLGVLTLASCESLIGLKDRTLMIDDGGSTDTPSKQACTQYCSDALKNCPAAKELEGYKQMDDCLAVCKNLPAGKANASSGNSVACRARAASRAGGLEAEVANCPAATPGGGTPNAGYNTCGSNCEGYCELFNNVCIGAPGYDPDKCIERCEALPDRGQYSANSDYLAGDTIQCRIAHLTAAAAAKEAGNDPERLEHCGAEDGHAAFRPMLNGVVTFCDLVPFERRCDDFCKLVMNTCTANPVYKDENQCLAVCEVLDEGESSSESNVDTLACRRWHAYYALTSSATTHCSHAGPIGDGHCGPKCAAYCGLLKSTCQAEFDSEFKGKLDDCVKACEPLSGATPTPDGVVGYDLNGEEVAKNTLQCRVSQLAQATAAAAEGAATSKFCASALPKANCSSR